MAKTKKVTFVKGTRATIVWDQKKGRPLVEFVNGLFTTSDPKVIRELTDLGYKTTEQYPQGPPPDGFDHQKTTMPPPKQTLGDLTPDTQDEAVVEQEPSPAKKEDIKSVKNQKTSKAKTAKKTAKRKPAKRVVKRRTK